jgi:hypothetical protein
LQLVLWFGLVSVLVIMTGLGESESVTEWGLRSVKDLFSPLRSHGGSNH